MRRRLCLPAILIAFVVLCAACSGVETRVSASDPFDNSPATVATEGTLGESSPTPEPVTTARLSLDRQMSECLVATSGPDSKLVEAFESNSFSDLSVDDQIAGSAAIFECAPERLSELFAEGLNTGFKNQSTMLPYFLGRCLERELSPSNPDRDSLLAGWTHLRTELPVPAEHRQVLVFTLTICVPDEVMGEVLLGEIGYDSPALLDSVSDDCLRDTLDGNDLRLFWETYVERPNQGAALEADKVIPALSSALRCASIGVMIAEQAAAIDGVELSTATIGCIDRTLDGVDMAPMYLSSVDSTEVRALASAAIDACLTPEERAARGS